MIIWNEWMWNVTLPHVVIIYSVINLFLLLWFIVDLNYCLVVLCLFIWHCLIITTFCTAIMITLRPTYSCCWSNVSECTACAHARTHTHHPGGKAWVTCHADGVRWRMTYGRFSHLGKRPGGLLWAMQRPRKTSLNKTAWKESLYPIVNPLIVKLRSKEWPWFRDKHYKIKVNAANKAHCSVMAL